MKIKNDVTKKLKKDSVKITNKVMLSIPVVTSIDAVAAGFTLTIFDVNSSVAFIIIAITTLILGGVGVFVGAKSGIWLETKAELFGGTVLVLNGFKLLFY